MVHDGSPPDAKVAFPGQVQVREDGGSLYILNAQLTVKAVPDHVADMPASPARRERRAGAAECDQCAAAAGQGITALMYLPGSFHTLIADPAGLVAAGDIAAHSRSMRVSNSRACCYRRAITHCSGQDPSSTSTEIAARRLRPASTAPAANGAGSSIPGVSTSGSGTAWVHCDGTMTLAGDHQLGDHLAELAGRIAGRG